MTTPVQVLIIDPPPEREWLMEALRELGVRPAIARGLHDALIQSILRNPVLILADRGGSADTAEACRRRLEQLPHFQHTTFLTIGDPGADLPTSLPRNELMAILEAHLPKPGLQAVQEPETGPEPIQAPEARADTLKDHLARLRADASSTTLTVLGPDDAVGEVMVREGRTIHAVTHAGQTGPEALEAMHSWTGVRIDTGPPPRPETPETVPAETDALVAENTENPAADLALDTLLTELEAVGFIRKVSP